MSAKHMAEDAEQSRAFIEAARELGCEEKLGRLDEMIRRVAKLPTRAAAMGAGEQADAGDGGREKPRPEAATAPEKRRREETAERDRASSRKET